MTMNAKKSPFFFAYEKPFLIFTLLNRSARQTSTPADLC
jgi:hypothetical protein